jgi:hypothetical protein
VNVHILPIRLISIRPVIKPPNNCPKLNNNDKYPSYALAWFGKSFPGITSPLKLFANTSILSCAIAPELAHLIKAINEPNKQIQTK